MVTSTQQNIKNLRHLYSQTFKLCMQLNQQSYRVFTDRCLMIYYRISQNVVTESRDYHVTRFVLEFL